MPVESLGEGNAQVHEPIGANKTIADVSRLPVVIKKQKKPVE